MAFINDDILLTPYETKLAQMTMTMKNTIAVMYDILRLSRNRGHFHNLTVVSL